MTLKEFKEYNDELFKACSLDYGLYSDYEKKQNAEEAIKILTCLKLVKQSLMIPLKQST